MNAKTLKIRSSWPEIFTPRSKSVLDRLAGIGFAGGFVGCNFSKADKNRSNLALMEAEPVVIEMYRNQGSPCRHAIPNPFYGRDRGNPGVMDMMLDGRARMVEIRTRDFINLSTLIDIDQSSTKAAIDSLVGGFEDGTDIDAVSFRIRPRAQRGSYKITTEDGRNRAYAAHQVGIPYIKAYLCMERAFDDYGRVTLVQKNSDWVQITLDRSGISRGTGPVELGIVCLNENNRRTKPANASTHGRE